MITFILPAALLALLIIPLLGSVALLGRRGMTRQVQAPLRFWVGLTLRSAIVAALALAAAGAQVVLPTSDLSVIFLLDVSDSVPLPQRHAAEEYVAQALADLPNGNRAGVIYFGAQGMVARAPAEDRTLPPPPPSPGGTRTNIADAVQLGLALLPPQGQRRLVLLSDGGANMGDTRAAARVAAARGVPIDVIPLSDSVAGTDAQIQITSLPNAARSGQQIPLSVTASTNITTSATLAVIANGQPVATQELQLLPGLRAVPVLLPAPQSGFTRYQVRLTVADDVRPQNNAAEGFVQVAGPAHILIIEGQPDAGRNLADALQVSGFMVERVLPSQAPASIGALTPFDAVALVDVPLHALLSGTAAALPVYVRDMGRGLAMIGGERSFGAGGYGGSQIEALLPVRVDPRPELLAPPVSLVIVIDTSGSMSEWDGGTSKAKLAAMGAAQIAAQLRAEDELTVIPYDSVPRNPVGPLPGTRSAEIIRQLRAMSPGARGITIASAINDAAAYLRASSSPLRHLITITDGDDTVEKDGALAAIQQLNDEGVTLTAVSVGGGRDVDFIREMARVGGGRFFFTEQGSDLPGILNEDARQVLRPYLVDRTFTPVVVGPTDAGVLRDLPALPPLHGYIATTPRDHAQVLLKAPQDDPLLAVWQYGLGRSAAWTSDMQGRWGSDLVRSPVFPRLAAQLMGSLLAPPNTGRLTVASQAAGDRLVVQASAQNEQGGAQNNLRITGRMIAADGTNRPLLLQEIAPGSYRALVTDALPGTYQVQITATNGDGAPYAAAESGAVVPPSSEYRRSNGDGERLLAAIAETGGGRFDLELGQVYAASSASVGRPVELAQPLLWLALLLLPLDIAARRVRLRSLGAWVRHDLPTVAAGLWYARQRKTQDAPAAPPIDISLLTDAELRRLQSELKEQARLRARARGLRETLRRPEDENPGTGG